MILLQNPDDASLKFT